MILLRNRTLITRVGSWSVLPAPWWLWWRRTIGRPGRCAASIGRSIPRRKKRSRWGRGRVGRRIRPWAFARCRGSCWAHRSRIRSSFSPKMPWNTQFSKEVNWLAGAAKRLALMHTADRSRGFRNTNKQLTTARNLSKALFVGWQRACSVRRRLTLLQSKNSTEAKDPSALFDCSLRTGPITGNPPASKTISAETTLLFGTSPHRTGLARLASVGRKVTQREGPARPRYSPWCQFPSIN